MFWIYPKTGLQFIFIENFVYIFIWVLWIYWRFVRIKLSNFFIILYNLLYLIRVVVFWLLIVHCWGQFCMQLCLFCIYSIIWCCPLFIFLIYCKGRRRFFNNFVISEIIFVFFVQFWDKIILDLFVYFWVGLLFVLLVVET